MHDLFQQIRLCVSALLFLLHQELSKDCLSILFYLGVFFLNQLLMHIFHNIGTTISDFSVMEKYLCGGVLQRIPCHTLHRKFLDFFHKVEPIL